jgi:uncharacterized membrane protein YciS (DUF1049 family)
MSRLVYLCIFLFVSFIGLIFHLRNNQPVLIDYYLDTLELPFSFIVVLVLSLGVILGVLVSIPVKMRLKRENARLLKQVSVTEKEINALRVIPIKDNI